MGITYQSHAATITLNTEVKWTDKNGNTHPANNVRAEFWDEDLIFDDLLDTQQTNNSGNASLTTDNSDGLFGGTLDPFMRIFPRSNAAFVSSDGTLGNTYPIKTATTNDVSGSVHNIPVTAGNGNDIGKSFSIHQAIQFHYDYATTRLGAATPAGGVKVKFPGGATNATATTMNVLPGDWADWDVIQHEYGHVLAFNNNLQGASLGNNHRFGADNISPLGKEKGTRLAWQEGIATYLALSAQDAGKLRTVIPNLPNELGDEFYDDTIDITLHVGIEGRNEGSPNVSEGDEASVMRILWDLYDEDTEKYFFDDEYSDKWNLGDLEVFNLMKGNQRLSDFWLDVADKHTPNFKRRSELGEVFEEYGVSSILRNPMDDVLLNPGKIKFMFEEQNSQHSDLFEVLVFDTTFTNIIDRSGVLNNLFNWTSNISFQPGDYHWVVLNNPVMLTSIDLKESYWSGAYEFSVATVPEPSTILGTVTALGLGSLLKKGRSKKQNKS